MACCVHGSIAGSTTSTTSTSTSSDGTRNVNWVEYQIREAREVRWGCLKAGNWTFNIQQFCKVAGVTQPTEIVKMAVTLLTGKASDLVAFGCQRELGKVGYLRLVRFLPCA